jgi:CheY-like chemotaxis protein
VNDRTVVLLVEDSPADARIVRENLACLEGDGFVLVHAERLAEGLERIAAGGIDAVLLDLSLPDSEGLDTLRCLLDGAPDIPIVVLTGNDDGTLAAQAVGMGAQDYLIKQALRADLLADTLRSITEPRRLLRDLRRPHRPGETGGGSP